MEFWRTVTRFYSLGTNGGDSDQFLVFVCKSRRNILSSFLYLNEIVQGSGPGVLVALEVRFGTKTYITLLQLINL